MKRAVQPRKRDGKRCEWFKDRGYYRGCQCCNQADFTVEERGLFCTSHVGMALDDVRWTQNKTLPKRGVIPKKET